MSCCNYERTKEDITRHLSIKQLLTMQDELNDFINQAWDGMLSRDHFKTAIVSELGEYLNDHGVGWKWWKAQPVDAYNKFGADVEIVDIVHFYLSLLVMQHRESMNKINACPSVKETEFDQFEVTYIGSDRGNAFSGSLICGGNQLSHTSFMVTLGYLLEDPQDIFDAIDTLDRFVSSAGFTSEYLSALYTAKSELNYFRQTSGYKDGTYQYKEVAGVEDNERLKPLIQAFMNDKTMTLANLRTNVQDEFFEEVV